MELFIIDRDHRGSRPDKNFFSITAIREELKDRCRDGVYTLRDPAGGVHTFTLDEWKNKDPDGTFLQIGFRTRNPRAFGRGAPILP